MPTSSITKEIIITDVEAFIEALEKSEEWSKKYQLNTIIEWHAPTDEEIKKMFEGREKDEKYFWDKLCIWA